MNKPLVSWLTTVYNCEKTLSDALDSMLNQTLQDFEIVIVVEYGCSKETCEICEKYEKEDSRIHIYYNKEKLGIGKSLNAGIAYCQGKYIARMDADDLSKPNRLEKQTLYMELHPEIGLIGCNADIIKNGEWVRTQYLGDDDVPDSEKIRARLLFETCFLHPGIMFRAEATEWQYPDEFSEDYAMYAEHLSSVKMAALPDVLLEYHEHDTSISFSQFETVKKSSIHISRKAIEHELEISTQHYGDDLFGWRCYNDMPDQPEEYLCQAISLYHSMKEANEKIKKFQQKALDEILEYEWINSKHLIRPYNMISRFSLPINKITESDINDIFFHLSLFVDRNKRVIFYGAGENGKKILEQIDQCGVADVAEICDSNSEKQGTIFCNRVILAPDFLKLSEEDIFITTRQYADEIRGFLTDRYNIPSSKIHVLDSTIPEKVILFHQVRNNIMLTESKFSDSYVRDIYYHLKLFTDKEKKVVLYGAGKQGKKILDQICRYGVAEVVAVCDTNHEKQGTDLCGITVASPDCLKGAREDICITTSLYAKEITEVLINRYAVDRDRIHILSEPLQEDIIRLYKKGVKTYEKAAGIVADTGI